MSLFPALFQGIGGAVSKIFQTPLGGTGAPTIGATLLGTGLGFGLQALQRAISPAAPTPIAPPPTPARGRVLEMSRGAGGVFATTGAPAAPITTIGRTSPTPGDSTMPFLPGVAGSFAPAAIGAGSAFLPALGRVAGQVLRSPVFQGGAAGAAGAAIFDGNGGGMGPGGMTPLFRATAAGARANSLVLAFNPVTGAPTFFRHAGRPLLFSGDLATARRVAKIGRRAARKR